jgi:hypothetical protein
MLRFREIGKQVAFGVFAFEAEGVGGDSELSQAEAEPTFGDWRVASIAGKPGPVGDFPKQGEELSGANSSEAGVGEDVADVRKQELGCSFQHCGVR